MTNEGRAQATDLREAETACHLAADAAEHVMRGDVSRPNVPTLLVVLAAAQSACRRAGNLFDAVAFEMEGHPELEVASAKPARVAKPAGACARHVFVEGVCTKCGKVKSANGRKPTLPPNFTPTAEERTLAPPVLPLGDAAADRFTGGGLGSSGVRR